MPTYKDIRTLARSLVGQVTESGESWKAFLDSAAYTYNYAFPNQLLIFSQRPDATAVASIDYWNNMALRWVNRGSHGIALLDSHSNRGKLRYVFDIADTHGREYVPQAMPWMVDNTNRQRVWEELKQTADADTVQNAIALRAATQAAEHRTQISRLLESTISGSTLEWRRREEQQKMLEKLVAQSAAYMMAKRCGIDTALLETDAFATVSEFDTDAIAVVLGSLTSQVSRPVLQSLGSLVRQIDSVALSAPEAHNQTEETQKEASRDGVHPSERVFDPESDTERTTGTADWQVRRDPQGVPAGEHAGDLRPDADGGDAVPPSAGSGQEREGADRTDHAAADPADAYAQPENRPAGLGAADESAESTGRGTGDADAVHPVNEDTQELEAESDETLPAFFVPEEQAEEMGLPDEEHQSRQVEQAAVTDNVQPLTPPVVDRTGEKITDEEITRALCDGSGFENGKLRIQYYFSQPVLPTMDETVHWLKKEYGIGGRSWELADGSQSWLDYNSKGFEIQCTTNDGRVNRLLTWREVSSRLQLLVQSNRYLTAEEYSEYEAWLSARQAEQAQKAADLEQAKEIIREYCSENDFEPPEFDDLSYINLVFSTDGEGDHEINIYADLVHHKLVYEVDDKHLLTSQYATTAELIAHELSGMSYDSLLDTAEEEFSKQQAELAAQVTPIKRPCAPGDVVYLENGKPYVVQDIGETDILVQDQDFPLFNRSIERENFSRLLGRDDRNADLQVLPLPDAVQEQPQPEESTAAVQAESQEESEDSPFVEQVMADAKALSEPYEYQPINYVAPYRPTVPGTPKEKFAANMEAIRTLKKVEQRVARGMAPANEDEQKILAQYSGWGGLADAFDPNKSSWSQEYRDLKAILTESEYQAARSSTLTAYFTPPEVIHTMYRALERMGVRGGNILEPSMGTGAFFAHKPSSFDLHSAKLYGVELDELTGRIARQLYQKARIQITGFEKADLPDSFFDCAVGNVPFGDFSVSDRAYDKLHFRIHDYFLAKTIDKVRTGGIIAMITTSGTMDKKSDTVRKYIAARCDLIGAVRLPNTTFKRNAGTEAVADILFLQKRDRLVERDEAWLHIGQTEDGIPINQYFVDHPEMVCGTIKMVSGPYGPTPTCEPSGEDTLEEQLDRALSHLSATLTKPEIAIEAAEEQDADVIEADPDVRNFSYTLKDGKIYFRTNSVMKEMRLGATADNRVRQLIALRDTVRELLQAQLDDLPDAEIHRLQTQLKKQYDTYTHAHGLINSRGSALAFQDDSSYYLLCSLEDVDENGKLKGLSDMFTKRTIRSAKPADRADTASDALALSIGEKACVDMPYMIQLTGKIEDEIVAELNGVIFEDPLEKTPDGGPVYRMADEYLSGNVRKKLEIARLAAAKDSRFRVHVDALEQVQPKDLDASEISVRLGATWIEPTIIKQFADELVDAPLVSRRMVDVHYAPYTGLWNISGKSITGGNIKASVTYGTNRANFYHILEESLNLRAIRIFDTVREADGSERRVLNPQETQAAQGKQQQIEDAFKEWIWKDQNRRQALVKLYNEKFNSTRPREYDGSHIQFHGMNPEITLRPHQRNAIAHILYGHNTLLGHVVGAGKTYEMVAAAMEKKRLGLCSKTLICVPNHLTEQMASEALQLYPNANILVAKRTDFEKANRKKFCGRIATGNYDIIVIGHSQFERIPLSNERQAHYLQSQIDEVIEQTAMLKREHAENFTVKQMERTRKQLEKRLEKLNNTERKDDVVTFEELGVDSLMIDEAHMFKNLMCVSKMRNVAGISQTESQRASDLLMKTMYLDEITGGRGVTFATGTPLSNSMTELYTMQRYLQRHTLEVNGLSNFDAWASTFGETVTAIELAPEGTGYRTKTRFAKFYNLPELMAMFKECADIQTADMLKLPVPELEGGKPINVQLQPSSIQRVMVSDLGRRADIVRGGGVDPKEDNMLKITNDGRKLALDQRLIDPQLPDDPNSKVNACVDRVFEIWERTKANRSTQLIFCDLSTPKAGIFNVYDDIRDKLVSRGIPKEEIQFIHDANTEVRKADLFAKVRSGTVRVLMGSTAKMGAGTNVQRKLIALHHLDVPWRPSDIEQREGRMVRQGNENKEVAIYRYVTEATFDAYSWQLIENKQRFIGQVMTSKSPARSCDDIDEAALSYAEVKALAAGNPAIKEKMDLDIQVTRLRTLKAQYTSQHYRLEDAVAIKFPTEIQKTKGVIANCSADANTVEQNTHLDSEGKDAFSICLMDTTYDKREDAGRALLGLIGAAMTSEKPVSIGSFKGLAVQAIFLPLGQEFHAQLVGTGVYDVPLGADTVGNITRIINAAAGITKRRDAAVNDLEQLEKQLRNAKDELQQPFQQEQELAEKSRRLAELNALLKMDEKDRVVDAVPDEDSQVFVRSARQRCSIER